jgi:hypothetical protein
MNKSARNSALALGIISIICAALGILYNALSMFTNFSGAFEVVVDKYKLPYFYQSFYIMSTVCVICFLILLFCGIEFLQSRTRFVWLFVSVMAFEVIYFLSMRFFCRIPGLADSVAAATGVANGGLMFQFLILFPIWGALLAVWTKRRFEQAASNGAANQTAGPGVSP